MTDSTQPPEGNSGFGQTGPGSQPSSGGYQPPTYESGGYEQQGPYRQNQGYGPGSNQTNGLAIAALVVGILALLSFFTIIGGLLLGLVAVVLGVMGLSKSKHMNGSGRGIAIGGIVTGVIGALLSLLLIIGAFAIGNQMIQDGGINIDGTEFEIPS